MEQAVDQRTARAILAEMVKRGLKAATVPKFVDERFEAQARFIADPARKKAALCTRRAGKTEGSARLLLKTAYENEGVKCLYVALTRPSAKGIMWPILKRLSRELALDGLTFNESDLTLHIVNGSEVILVGADAADGLKERFKGWKFKLVVIDECASWKAHIRDLVNDVLRPTLVDLRGTLCMIGTPGEVPAGLFYDVSTGKEPGWALHKWATSDNPYMTAQFEAEIAEMKAENPAVVETPWFRRNYLAEWVMESSRLVYRFSAERNTYAELPRLDAGDAWRWVLGIDLGWDDATAFVLGCWAKSARDFYVVEAYKRSGMLLGEVDEKIRELRDRHRIQAFSHVVVDNAAKQAVEDMRSRFGWNFEAAEKSGKVGFISAVNNDLILGRVKVGPLCDPLVSELANHTWAPKKKPDELEQPEEEPTSPNHCSDAFLYAYRAARHYLHQAKPPAGPAPGTPEWQAKIEADMQRRVADRVKAENSSAPPWVRRRHIG